MISKSILRQFKFPFKQEAGDFSRIFPIFSTFRPSVFMNPLKWKCPKHGV